MPQIIDLDELNKDKGDIKAILIAWYHVLAPMYRQEVARTTIEELMIKRARELTPNQIMELIKKLG